MNISCLKEAVINCTDRDFSQIERTFREASVGFPVPACRVQVGSYACGNYFFALLRRMAQAPPPDGSYDLVLPVFSESQLERFEAADTCPALRNARWVVVNDFGMLRRFRGDSRVRLGRLIFPEYRDRRYPEYEAGDSGQGKSGALAAVLRELGFTVRAMELDIATRSETVRLEGVDVYYHFPYRQVSVSHICEFASIGKPIPEKFVPDSGCALQCFHTSLRSEEPQYRKIGRNVFDQLEEDWLPAEGFTHMIYTPGW